MAENLALYRRYRSATFAEVIGQDHVTTPLSQALTSGRINHAYLFSGPRGCGKTSSARILARSLNCIQGPTATPCGVCDSCVELAPNGPGSIDVIEIDAASHGGVDDARDLRERAFYAPVRDRYKVYIIDEAHMVTTQGFNALLKLIEEPPGFLVFIFATTEPDKVLQTIRSRTHHYPFRLIPPAAMRAHLEKICAAEGISVEPAVLPLVVRAGGGSARDSLSLLDQLLAGAGSTGVTYPEAVALLGVTDAALLDDMVDALAAGDAAGVYGTIDRVVEAGHDPRRFASDLLDRFRDLIVLDAVSDALTLGLITAPQDELAHMSDQAARLGGATLTRYAEIVHSALIEMRGTTSPRLVLELLCARMQLPDAAADSAAILQRLERLERRQTLVQTGDAVEPEASPTPPAQAPVRPAPAAAEPVATASPAAAIAQPAPPVQPVPAQVAAQPEPVVAPVAPTAAPVPPTAPPPTPTPPPARTAGVVDATALRAVWPEVLEVVKQTNRTTRALLDNAQVAGLSSDVVTLSAVSAPLARMLGEDRNTSILSAALASVLGGKWKVVVETGPPGGAAASAAAPPSPPTTDWSGSSGASTPTAESAAPSGYQAAAPDDIPDDPRDISEPDDPDAGASKVDPETDALRLLQDTLGARPLDA